MSRPAFLSLFDRSGVMVRPWAEAGWPCVCVDLQHDGVTTQDGITFVGADAKAWRPGTYAIAFAFPPCDHLAGSGARWFQDKGLEGLHEALDLVRAAKTVCEGSGCPWMIENPVGTLATYWRQPDFIFNPSEYGGWLPGGGDRYTKKTCIWTGGGFQLPIKRPVEPTEGSRMHLLPPSAERKNLRSKTPEGFARAVFEANKQSAVSGRW